MKVYDRFCVAIETSSNSSDIVSATDHSEWLQNELSKYLPGKWTVTLKDGTDFVRIDYYDGRPVLMWPEGCTIKWGDLPTKYTVAIFDDPKYNQWSKIIKINNGEFFLPTLDLAPDVPGSGGKQWYRLSLAMVALGYKQEVVYNAWNIDLQEQNNLTQEDLNTILNPYLVFSGLDSNTCSIEKQDKHFRLRWDIKSTLNMMFNDTNNDYSYIKINNPYDASKNLIVYPGQLQTQPHHGFGGTGDANSATEIKKKFYDEAEKVYENKDLNCCIFQLSLAATGDNFIFSIDQYNGDMVSDGGQVIAHGGMSSLSEEARQIIEQSGIDCQLYQDVLVDSPKTVTLWVIYENWSTVGSYFEVSWTEGSVQPSFVYLYLDDISLVQNANRLYLNKGAQWPWSSWIGSFHNPDYIYETRDFDHSIKEDIVCTPRTFFDMDRDVADTSPFYPFVKNKTFNFTESPFYNYEGGYLSYITQTKSEPSSWDEDEGYHFNEKFSYTHNFSSKDTRNWAMYKYTPFLMASNWEAYEKDNVKVQISYNTSTRLLSVTQTINEIVTSNQLTLKSTDRVLMYARLPVELNDDRQLPEWRKYKMPPSYEIIEYYDHSKNEWATASDENGKNQLPDTMFFGRGAPVNSTDAQKPEVYAIIDGKKRTWKEYEVDGNYVILDMTDFIQEYPVITITPTDIQFKDQDNDYKSPLQFFVQEPWSKLQEAKVFPYTTIIDEKDITVEWPPITGGSNSDKGPNIAKSNTIASSLETPNDPMKEGWGVKLTWSQFPELMSIDKDEYWISGGDYARMTVLTTNALWSGADGLPEKSNTDGTSPAGSTYFALMGSTVVPLLGYVAPHRSRKLDRSKTTTTPLANVTYGFYSDAGGYTPEIAETCFVRPFEITLDDKLYYMTTWYSRPKTVVDLYEDTRTIATALVVWDCDQVYSKPNTNPMPDYSVVVLEVAPPVFSKNNSRPGYYHVANDNDFAVQLLDNGDYCIDIEAKSSVEYALVYGGNYYFKVSGRSETSETVKYENAWLEVTPSGTDHQYQRPIFQTSADCHGYFYMDSKWYYYGECDYKANETKTFGYSTAKIKYILFDTDTTRIKSGKPVPDLPRTKTSSLYFKPWAEKGTPNYEKGA